MRFHNITKIKIIFISVFSILVFTSLGVYAENAEVLKPNVIAINPNAQVNIELSNTDINRIFVKNEKITSIDAPGNLLTARNDNTGNIYSNINGKSPFTAFVSTNLGLHFSLLISPKSVPGQTVEFDAPILQSKPVDRTVVIQHNANAQGFEQSAPYERTLVRLLKDVMIQKTPAGYTEILPKAFSQIPIFSVSSNVANSNGLEQSVVGGYLGGELAVRVISVKNDTSKPVQLYENQFYAPGVRAVSISNEDLGANGKTTVFEVISNA